jgi:putative phosphoesterase
MKIAVFSDSHSDVASIIKTIEKEKPDIVFHLGDHASDTARIKLPPYVNALHTVLGNCDIGDYPTELLIRLDGRLFYLMHGHTKGVKLGLDRAIASAIEKGADALLYGHTHVPKIDFYRNLLVFNPGSSRKSPASGQNGTYGVITLENGILKPDIRPVSRRLF